MTRRVWEIAAAGQGRIVEEPIPTLGPQDILVEAAWGALSPGSESLVSRGGLPADLALDDSIAGMDAARYPLRYGYILTGRVAAVGAGLSTEDWLGERVFAFHPHASHAVVPAHGVIRIPHGIPADLAPLYANLETALTLQWDAAILTGESAMIQGLGIVGLLSALLAARRDPAHLVLVDRDEQRRAVAQAVLMDPQTRFDPERVHVLSRAGDAGTLASTFDSGNHGRYGGFDVVIEVTGAPAALDPALQALAYGGRLVLGSWHGDSSVELALGGRFHRARLRLVSSQVSTIPGAVMGRIDHARRTRLVWDMMPRLGLDRIPRQVVGLEDIPVLLGDHAGGSGTAEPYVLVRY